MHEKRVLPCHVIPKESYVASDLRSYPGKLKCTLEKVGRKALPEAQRGGTCALRVSSLERRITDDPAGRAHWYIIIRYLTTHTHTCLPHNCVLKMNSLSTIHQRPQCVYLCVFCDGGLTDVGVLEQTTDPRLPLQLLMIWKKKHKQVISSAFHRPPPATRIAGGTRAVLLGGPSGAKLTSGVSLNLSSRDVLVGSF